MQPPAHDTEEGSADDNDAQTDTSGVDDPLSPAFVAACGLSVMAFVTFVALNQLPTATYGDGGFVAFVLTIPFFFGAYVAARGFFAGVEKETAADD
ncbi:hypothetical protein [Halogranum gelatinilyticum]|uniref:hypothetical protein n=1 Tax=Halogranum gelatinilyticum TaxID=660521 RepID=UPI00111404A4|nr:hypothetical protein [Halogranum gelatinilyticum]